MCSRNAATVDNNNDDYPLHNDDVYVYKGGEIHEANRDKIKDVRIDESISIIDDKAFHYCTNLRTVSFSTNSHNLLKNIGKNSFEWCLSLSSINLQDTQIETIGDYAFHYCNTLTTVQLPPTVRQIGKSCFQNCHLLESVDLLHVNHLESIGEATFSNCTALKTINLPPTTLHIGKESFNSCRALETVNLRETSVTEIGEAAFAVCKSLSTIYFPTKIKHVGTLSFCSCKKLLTLDLQATCTESIGVRAFYECSNLKIIQFPKTLKHIGKESFRNCTNLKYLNLQETSIERIGDHAFYNCINLAMVVGISNSHREEDVEENMGDDMMKFPASLVYIGKCPFYGCPKLGKSIDNNWIHFEGDINRGGRRFLQRDHQHHPHHHHQDVDSNDDGDAKRHGKVYCSSLWPLILYRVMNEMELPKQTICPKNDDNLSLYVYANPLQRRASVVFHLLIHGVVADLLPQAASASSISGLNKTRKIG